MEKTSDVYDKLYHYTTEAGLDGILATQCLWSTHVSYLNDVTELVHFKEIAPSLIFPQVHAVYSELAEKKPKAREFLKQNGGVKTVAERDSAKIIDAMYQVTGDNFFVTSFCGEHAEDYVNQNGLLSQWRGYGGDQGVMIEFEAKGLEELLKAEAASFAYDNLHLSDVVYADDEKLLQADLSPFISSIADHAASLLRHQLFRDAEAGASEAMSGFAQCVTRYKHRGFKEEREVRIAAWVREKAKQEQIEKLGGEPQTLKEIKQRQRNGQVVPYIELFGGAKNRLPIRKIVIGPHAKKEDLADRMRKKLDGTGIEVAVSEIPYVNLYSQS